MPLVEIAQIQLRRGSQSQLPGAPTSLSPLTFAPGLKAGEIALVEELGRVFMGHNPSVGHANYQRSAFPYQNVEVLTENSTDTFRRMWDQLSRSNETGYYVSEPIAADGLWNTVLVPPPAGVTGVPSQPFTVSFPPGGPEVTARVVYNVLAGGTIHKAGVMTIMYDGLVDPMLTDEYTSDRTSVLGSPGDPGDIFSKVLFRVATAGVGASELQLQARNLLGVPATLRFRVDRPRS